jgi:hypothetical protein
MRKKFELPARHAMNRVEGKQIFQINKELTQLDQEYLHEV